MFYKTNTIRLITPQIAASLEAEPVLDNQILLNFNVRSRNIDWRKHVMPLLPRAPPIYLQRNYWIMSNQREPMTFRNRREVLVCHDMMGNYLEDRHFESSRKFDAYRYYHWSGIDYFCYFSHNYITIPPCGWINAAHKHGVRILGTYIVEYKDGCKLLQEVLSSKTMIENIVTAMIKLCEHFCFDGWLVNVECIVKPELMENLYYFVERLRNETERKLEHGIVFWYDSITENGELSWQNELNSKNIRFFRVSDGMLINYNWDDKSLEDTEILCNEQHFSYHRVFFGIDIFGRGQLARFKTRTTLERIARKAFSTGIFAPAWVFETLRQYGYNIDEPLGNTSLNEAFLLRNEQFWSLLWEFFATHPYKELPFYTDFCLGSGKRMYNKGQYNVEDSVSFFNLSHQSMQPSVPLHNCAERYYDDAFNGGSSLRIIKTDIPFRLFTFDCVLRDHGLIIVYAHKLQPKYGELDVIVRLSQVDNDKRDCYIFLGEYTPKITLLKGRCYISPLNDRGIEMLTRDLQTEQLLKILPAYPTDWSVRCYAMGFDEATRLLDIGVLQRCNKNETKEAALLGAIYVQPYDTRMHQFSFESNYADIQLHYGNLINDDTAEQ